MEVNIATTPAEILNCYPIMVQLHPGLTEEEFLAQVQRQAKEGYRLAYLKDDGAIRAVAGFRLQEMLSRGRFLYIDDLVTDEGARSHGYGSALFAWLVRYARDQGCQRIELDSGVHRHEAHRFYFAQGMHISSYHFSLDLGLRSETSPQG